MALTIIEKLKTDQRQVVALGIEGSANKVLNFSRILLSNELNYFTHSNSFGRSVLV